ncbi:hypothetical protein [Streptomyces sp. R35]|uniref:Uncharacterized protein n=1 Tax=Streptomyces sp. R35 TaxID=3238630 RepID=A0AB39SJZ1_9ACTN
MTDKNEKLKPPPRRTGRTLGGAKKTALPPPPPTAELTPEQFAAEQATAEGEGRADAGAPQVQPAPSTDPVEASAQSPGETKTKVSQPYPQLTVEATPSGPVQEATASQQAHPAVIVPEFRMESAVHPIEGQVPPGAPAAQPAAPAVQPTQQAEPIAQHGLSQVPFAASGAAPAAEVAVRPAVAPVPGGTAFPVRTDAPGSHQEQDMRSPAAPSEGTPWAQGPGRPRDIPEAAVVLNQRIIARESLDSSVPAALKLKKRIKRFALDNELDHLPIGDIVSVALDEWLSTRGF